MREGMRGFRGSVLIPRLPNPLAKRGEGGKRKRKGGGGGEQKIDLDQTDC